MKKLILLSAALLPMAMMAKAPELVNQPAPLPSPITNVSPEQGFVDLSGDKNPTGVAEITFTFPTNQIHANKDVHAELYKDGELLTHNVLPAAIDAMGFPTASVYFSKGKITEPGWYEVRIPAGQFEYGGKLGEPDPETGDAPIVGGDPTPAFSVFYQINPRFSITPASGVVVNLDGITASFAGADEIRLTTNSAILGELSCFTSAIYYDVTPIVQGNQVYFSLGRGGIAAEIFEAGVYNVNIPAGLMTAVVYGPNYKEDPTDIIEYTSHRYNMSYEVPSSSQPGIYPDNSDPVKSFFEFELEMPEGLDLLFADTMGFSNIYAVNEDGSLATDTPIAEVQVTGWDAEQPTSNGKGIVFLKVLDPATRVFATEPIVPLPGLYALQLAPSCFSGYWHSKLEGSNPIQVFCPPFRYDYKVVGDPSKVDGLDKAEETLTVYNLSGSLVGKGLKNIDSLAPGLYIVNGKKVMKTRR